MKTAQQAKDATEKLRQDWKDASWAGLQTDIDDRIKQGYYTLQAILTERERDLFIELGYTVTKVGGANSSTYDINWKYINEEV